MGNTCWTLSAESPAVPYTVTLTALPEVLILTPKVFEDPRGFFLESFNVRDFETATGLKREFVQDNHSRSAKGVLRGLHYQLQRPQGKLVRVVHGVVFDVAVDLRRNSPNFGKWVGVTLSAENKRQLWILEGFAHGFLVVSDWAEFLYKTTEFWFPDDERVLLWNDPALSISWPKIEEVFLSERDKYGRLLSLSEHYD